MDFPKSIWSITHCWNWSQVNLKTELKALPQWLNLRYTTRGWTKESLFKDTIHLIWLLIHLKVLGIKRKVWIVVSLWAGRIPVEQSQIIIWYNLLFYETLHSMQDSYNFHMIICREYCHVWFFNELSVPWLVSFSTCEQCTSSASSTYGHWNSWENTELSPISFVLFLTKFDVAHIKNN